jgi:hypothetical protein
VLLPSAPSPRVQMRKAPALSTPGRLSVPVSLLPEQKVSFLFYSLFILFYIPGISCLSDGVGKRLELKYVHMYDN